MIEMIGSWVYVIAVATIVVAFVELLTPRSAATGLTQVVVGLCIIALVLDLVFSLFSVELQLDTVGSFRVPLDADYTAQFISAGRALAEGTLSAVEQTDLAANDSNSLPTGSKAESNFLIQVSTTIEQIRVHSIPRAGVGVRHD